MNQLMKFEDNEVGVVVIDGKPLFELYSTGMALGYAELKKGKMYARKPRINNIVKNIEISTVLHAGEK